VFANHGQQRSYRGYNESLAQHGPSHYLALLQPAVAQNGNVPTGLIGLGENEWRLLGVLIPPISDCRNYVAQSVMCPCPLMPALEMAGLVNWVT